MFACACIEWKILQRFACLHVPRFVAYSNLSHCRKSCPDVWIGQSTLELAACLCHYSAPCMHTCASLHAYFHRNVCARAHWMEEFLRVLSASLLCRSFQCIPLQKKLRRRVTWSVNTWFSLLVLHAKRHINVTATVANVEILSKEHNRRTKYHGR